MGEAVKNVRATGGIKEVTWEVVITPDVSGGQPDTRPKFTKTDFAAPVRKAAGPQIPERESS